MPRPRQSDYSIGYSDYDREQAQQEVINGIKGRLTDPLRIPYNFIKGPIIGWDAPKAFVSDMGFLTMPQLVLSGRDRRQRPRRRPLLSRRMRRRPRRQHRSAGRNSAAGRQPSAW